MFELFFIYKNTSYLIFDIFPAFKGIKITEDTYMPDKNSFIYKQSSHVATAPFQLLSSLFLVIFIDKELLVFGISEVSKVSILSLALMTAIFWLITAMTAYTKGTSSALTTNLTINFAFLMSLSALEKPQIPAALMALVCAALIIAFFAMLKKEFIHDETKMLIVEVSSVVMKIAIGTATVIGAVNVSATEIEVYAQFALTLWIVLIASIILPILPSRSSKLNPCLNR